KGSLYGLANQVEFLRQAGAISLQCTVHTPAPGTREYEQTYETGKVLRRVGSFTIAESLIDGNHITVLTEEPAWLRQLKLLGGYAAFYNPLNMMRALRHRESLLWRRRFGYQVAGQVATVWTGLKLLPYLLRLLTGRLECHTAPPPMQYVPVRNARGA